MEYNQFKLFLENFNFKTSVERNVFIWNFSETELLNLIQGNDYYVFDILTILNNLNDDSDEKDISFLIEEEINSYILKLKKVENDKLILIIKNNEILSRYHVPLSAFFNNFLSNKTALIFFVKNSFINEKLPDFVLFKKDIILDFFIKVLGEDKLVKEV